MTYENVTAAKQECKKRSRTDKFTYVLENENIIVCEE